jgi:hypothetical protein
MRGVVLPTLLLVALAACGNNSPEVGGPLPTTPMNDPALSRAAGAVQPLLDSRFKSTYAGLEVRNEVPMLVIYRKPDPELDTAVRMAAPDVRIEFRDARYTRAEMAEHVQRVMDDTVYWQNRGVEIVFAGPDVDGSGVKVGSTNAPGDFARQLEERYPAMSFNVEQSGKIVPAPYLGPPVFPTGWPGSTNRAVSSREISKCRTRNERSSSFLRRSQPVTSALHLLALHDPHAGTTLPSVYRPPREMACTQSFCSDPAGEPQ